MCLQNLAVMEVTAGREREKKGPGRVQRASSPNGLLAVAGKVVVQIEVLFGVQRPAAEASVRCQACGAGQ